MKELGRNRHRDEKITLKWTLKKWGCDVLDLIHVDQDRVQWWVLVNVVMNLEVSFYETAF
jgi:hypothetical protein